MDDDAPDGSDGMAEESPPPPSSFAPLHGDDLPYVGAPPAFLNDHDGDDDDETATDGVSVAADGDGDDDIEALAAKACALASVPVPDYIEAFAHQERRDRAKQGKKTYSISRYKDKALGRARKDTDPNSVVLANKTSNILSEFQDYITEINSEGSGNSGREILDYRRGDSGGGEETIAFNNRGAEEYVEGGSGSDEVEKELIECEWSRDGYVGQSSPDRNNGRNLYSIKGDDDDDDDDNAIGKGGRLGYAFPIFRSRKFKTGITVTTLLCVLLFTVVALSNGGGRENTEEEQLDRVEGIDMKQAKDRHDVEPTGPDSILGEKPSGPRGKSHKSPSAQIGSPDNQVDGSNEGGDNSPDVSDDGGEGSAPADGGHADADAQTLQMAYRDAALKYMPIGYDHTHGWEGRTYDEAFRFCGMQGGRTLCPYQAICPAGQGREPLGSYWYRNEEGGDDGSWVPVLDVEGNQWVQVSEKDSCLLYTSVHPDGRPEWGLNNGEEGGEAATRHIFCCVDVGEEGKATDEAEFLAQAEAEEADRDAYLAKAAQYQPAFFSREDGWEGTTYLDAVKFCARLEGSDVCPYEAVCPLGPDNKPLAGYKDGEEGEGKPSWVPISDGPNNWASLGSDHPCARLNVAYTEDPQWGGEGDDNEEYTRHILCCRGSVEDSAGESYLYKGARQLKFRDYGTL